MIIHVAFLAPAPVWVVVASLAPAAHVLVGVADASVAVIIDVALHASALLGIADTTAAVIIDLAPAQAHADVADVAVAVVIGVALHAHALAGVADRPDGTIATTIVVVVAHHASAVVHVADIIMPRTVIVRGTGAAEAVVAGAIGTETEGDSNLRHTAEGIIAAG